MLKKVQYQRGAIIMAMLGTLTGFGSFSGLLGIQNSLLLLEESILFSVIVGLGLYSLKSFLFK